MTIARKQADAISWRGIAVKAAENGATLWRISTPKAACEEPAMRSVGARCRETPGARSSGDFSPRVVDALAFKRTGVSKTPVFPGRQRAEYGSMSLRRFHSRLVELIFLVGSSVP